MDQPQPHTEYASQVGELNHPGARDLLATQTLTRLAYTGPDGLPRVIPIGFHWTGEHIIVCTVPSPGRRGGVKPNSWPSASRNAGRGRW